MSLKLFGVSLLILSSLTIFAADFRAPYCPDDFCGVSQIVFGDDDRTQIFDTTKFPESTLGQLYMKEGSKTTACTGTMIGPNQVITAAHCVMGKKDWVNEISFYPAKTSKEKTPFGKVMVKKVFIPRDYYRYQGDFSDFALLILERPIGEETGWLGFFKFKGYGVNYVTTIAGYPGDKEFGTLWQTTCTAEVYPRVAEYHCDTYGGQSGAALRTTINDGEYIYGVHNSSIMGANSGIVFNEENFNLINSWYDLIITKDTAHKEF